MELENHIDDPAYQTIVYQMKEKLLEYFMSTADYVPMTKDPR